MGQPFTKLLHSTASIVNKLYWVELNRILTCDKFLAFTFFNGHTLHLVPTILSIKHNNNVERSW